MPLKYLTKTYSIWWTVTEQMIKQAENHADEITSGANTYADDILANLQLLVTKMQKNLINLDKNPKGSLIFEEYPSTSLEKNL